MSYFKQSRTRPVYVVAVYNSSRTERKRFPNRHEGQKYADKLQALGTATSIRIEEAP